MSEGDGLCLSPNPTLWGRLTERERYIVTCVSQGRADKDIGHDLGVCPTTVHTTLVRLKKRVGGVNRVDTILKLAGVDAGIQEPAEADNPEWWKAYSEMKEATDDDRRSAGVRARWGNDCKRRGLKVTAP